MNCSKFVFETRTLLKPSYLLPEVKMKLIVLSHLYVFVPFKRSTITAYNKPLRVREFADTGDR